MIWQSVRRNTTVGAIVFLTLLGNLLLGGCGGGSSSVTLPGGSTGGTNGGSNGGDTGGNNGGNSGGAALTAEQRVASLEAAREKFQSLVGQDPAAANGELVRFLQSRPEFEAVGEDRDMLSVWARYRDGRLMVIPNNRPPEPGGGRAAVPGAPGRAAELPSGKRVRLLHAFGPGFDEGQSALDDVRGWLTANGYEDVPVQEGDARISSLKNVRGDSLLWFNTHGAPGRRRDGTDAFTLWTSSKVDVNTERIPEIDDDLEKGRLAYSPGIVGTDAGGSPVVENHYAITPEFVSQYMQFEQNSLILMTVCYSANPRPPIRAMIQAFHDRGAGVYVGWTNVINTSVGFRAAKIIVDWLLGGNHYEVQNPPQRPFDLGQVVSYLHDRGWDVYPASGAQLKIEEPMIRPQNGFGLLAPSISFVVDDTTRDELVIQGEFGQDPGTDRSVTINGVDLTITKWTDAEIRCTLPRTGAGAAGDVIVTVRGHRSNPRWLTEWRGDFRYSFTAPGSLSQTITFRLHFRADVSSLRGTPGTAPFQPRLVGAFLAGDSDAGYSASGEATATDNDCTTTLRWSGSGPLPRFVPGSVSPPPFWLGQVLLNPGGRAISLQLEANSGDAMITEARHTVCPNGNSDNESPNALRIISDVFKDPSGTLDMTFDSDFNIQAGSRQKTIVFGGLPGGPRDAVARLEWSRIASRFAPDPNAARSVRR